MRVVFRTYSRRTGSYIGRLHRPDLFLDVVRDMLGQSAPLSVRALASQLKLNKNTIWRWRHLVFGALDGSSSGTFSGIVEADEVHQREPRKGSRECLRHHRDPLNHPRPPRLRWQDYRAKGIKMKRGLSSWQLPILTVADRHGARIARRSPDKRDASVIGALTPLVQQDAVLCSDALTGYAASARARQISHFVVGPKPGKRM